MSIANRIGLRVAAAAVATGAIAAGGLAVAGSAGASTAAVSSHTSVSYRFQTLDNARDLTFNQLLGINGHGLIAGYFGSGAAGHPKRATCCSRGTVGTTIATRTSRARSRPR